MNDTEMHTKGQNNTRGSVEEKEKAPLKRKRKG